MWRPHSYFTRVSQIKEQLEAVDEEVENAKIVMTTLNGLPRTWDSFIQGICARNKLVKFSRLWEECSQEKYWIVAREEKMGSEDQALIVQSKKPRSNHHKSKYSHHRNKSRKPRDRSKYIFYTCDERGHFTRDCPRKKIALTRRRETILALDAVMKWKIH